eukprot:CAMPEP_0201512758 /NCGR_PEP_ID=MMETSP0161_2-20130828/4959_1 /ASSEMBLY_ACC=CAM_ASM_000251 /TAXON_ID=180227 /ORGANISM="Neoparamoeba aestuarina, Strain SoJaBio B1-5/56/2" /LENGTH=183 /DNA_ID=CAMNT_0047908727 /DNA_START=297 /DNA_END=845 /DNA_ORIENTATION=+
MPLTLSPQTDLHKMFSPPHQRPKKEREKEEKKEKRGEEKRKEKKKKRKRTNLSLVSIDLSFFFPSRLYLKMGEWGIREGKKGEERENEGEGGRRGANRKEWFDSIRTSEECFLSLLEKESFSSSCWKMNAFRRGDGETTLHACVWKEYKTATALCVGRGADTTARRADGWTPLHSACAKNDEE